VFDDGTVASQSRQIMPIRFKPIRYTSQYGKTQHPARSCKGSDYARWQRPSNGPSERAKDPET